MPVINTNVKSLVSQSSLMKNERSLSTSMERLSTGKRINSAKDDAAGLAIGTRMEAQTRGLTMAIKNANDGISLVQTAEGAMDEVSNILQRMRELAVQSVNGTNNAADRRAMDDEVKQLKSEIERIATTTEFNSMKLLDGSFQKKVLQIGDKGYQTMQLDVASTKLQDLGMSPGSFGGNIMVSNRIALAAVDKGDILINGQELNKIAALDDIEDVINNINTNVDNVTASGFNTVVAKNIGNGVTADGDFQINVTGLGATNATTFKISASNSMDELVANINAEAGGLVQATKDETGRLVLSNTTGATISINDLSGSGVGRYDGGSGFLEAGASGTYTDSVFNGFLKLESKDGSPIRVERGNKGMVSPGALSDLATLGFREVTTEPVNENYVTTGLALTSAGVTGTWNKTDLTINGIEIWDETLETNSFQGKLNAINNFTKETGVSASAYFEKSFDMTDVTFPSDQAVLINGTQIELGASLSDFADNVNAATGSTGLVATINGKNLTLSGSNVQTTRIQLVNPDVTTALTSAVSAKTATTSAQRTITISSADVVVGRTIEIRVKGSGAASAQTFAAAYTIQLGDTKSSVARGLTNSIIATAFQANGQKGVAGTTYDGLSATVVSASSNVITLSAALGAYGDKEISLHTTHARLQNITVNSDVSDPGADSAAAVTITIASSDVVAGRTMQLSLYQGATSADNVGRTLTVQYTIQAGDDKDDVATALADAIKETTQGTYAGIGSGYSGTAGSVTSAAGAITIAANANYGLSYGNISFIKPALGGTATHYGAIRLDSNNNQPISIALGDSASEAEHGFFEMNVGAADFEVNKPTLGVASGSSLTGLTVATAGDATKAIGVIDNAIEKVSSARSYLGAVQNRLTSTVNNLDNIVTNTQASKSRIMDADYSKETASLARAQIIQQAATAMLAQANQQPQGVLALLR
jgi:flagellin